ncbi:MAG TPA: oligosaccharide flippase family protein [Candidatus Thermoplasmatota archaeon]|nr:oligosaccharide flippase family protein [Candidatus Thermoplasmatota archaeon]
MGIAGRRDLMGDSLAYLAAKALPAAASAIALIMATRALTPTELGLLGIAVVAATTSAIFLGVGVDHAAARFLPAYEQRDRLMLFLSAHSTLVARVLGIAVSLSLITLLAVAGWASSYRLLAIAACALTVAMLAFNFSGAILTAKRLARQFAVVEASRGLALLTFSGLVVYIQPDPEMFVFAMAAAYALGLIVSLSQSKLHRFIGSNLDMPYLREAAAYSLPLVGWFVGVQAMGLIERLVIARFHGTDAVGIYHANAQLIPGSMGLLLAPLVMAAHGILMRFPAVPGAEAMLEEQLKRFTRIYLAVALPLATAISLLAADISQLLVGPELNGGYIAIPWLCFAVTALHLGNYAHKRFELDSRTGVMFAAMMICVATNAGLDVWLVPTRGLQGAAIAAAASSGLYPTLCMVVPSRIQWRFPWRSAVRIVFACLIASLLLAIAIPWFTTWPTIAALAFSGSTFFVTYLLALFLSGELVEEKAALARWTSKGGHL